MGERGEETMRVKDLASLTLLATLWGGSFLFMRVAVPLFGPPLLAFLRVGLAGAGLLAYAAALGRVPALRGRWRAYLALGALNAAIPYALIAAAELHLTASLAAILNATTPLFAAIVAAARLGERLTARVALGLALGLAGVAILVGWSPLPLDRALLLAVGASLVAALSYALAGVYAKATFAGEPPLTLAIGQQLGAAALLLPLALPRVAVEPATLRPSFAVGAATIALALLSTSLAYLLYFSLIASAGPTRTLSVTFLVPVFGVLWSVLFLRETVGPATLAGLAIILASVLLVTGVRLPALPFPGRPRPARDPAWDHYEI
jgi:drug/metabolite transporter (DMT)-like permease